MKGVYYMKLCPKPKTSRGFTLIELLIVIALLGALAVGLIGAIDPFEQLKKGADTGTRDIVNQVQTAVIRYYSVKNDFPWTSDPTSETLAGSNMVTAISNMINAGELKSDFTTLQRANLDKVFVTGNALQNSAVVCYLPTSKSFQADPNTKYTDATGATEDTEGTTCKSGTGQSNCYWCIR